MNFAEPTTYEAEVRARDAADLETLTAALDAAQVDHEVWTANVRILCRQCSEGTPHEHISEDDKLTAWPDTHVIGISTTSPAVAQKVLVRWSSGGGGFLNRLVGKASNNVSLR